MESKPIIKVAPAARNGLSVYGSVANATRAKRAANAHAWRQELALAIAKRNCERPGRPTLRVVNAEDVTEAPAAEPIPTIGRTAPSKDVVRVRLACLKAAAEYAAQRPDLNSDDVVRIAEDWSAWVSR
ncbi:MAG: hypothetical protein U0821_17610 [Chloroflexota bacterium]